LCKKQLINEIHYAFAENIRPVCIILDEDVTSDEVYVVDGKWAKWKAATGGGAGRWAVDKPQPNLGQENQTKIPN